jgi:hypothetical protein
MFKEEMKDSESMTDDTLSQADILLPSQYFGAMGSSGLSGEQRLMLAVLVDAINVLQSWKGSGSARKRRNFAEAVSWVNSPGTAHTFAFDSVCDALDINSGLLRSRLQRLTVRPVNSTGPLIPRLRLKELSRSPQMTPSRPRRRRAPRIRKAPMGPGSDSTLPSVTAPFVASVSLNRAGAITGISYQANLGN